MKVFGVWGRAGALVLCGGLAVTAAGCSNAPPVDPILVSESFPGPRGGKAVALPGDIGFAEVVVEPSKDSTRADRRVCLAVYFIGPDRKSALSTLPTTVSATVYTPDSPEPKTVALRPEPDAKQSEGAGRYVSPAGDYEYDELRGELTIELNGESIKRTFSRM